MKILHSNKIVNAYTIGSMYDNDAIGVRTKDGTFYRLKAEDILKIINNSGMSFTLHKPRKHTYLKVIV